MTTVTISQLSQEQVKHIREVFCLFDVDLSGVITAEEMRNAIGAMGTCPPYAMFTQMDRLHGIALLHVVLAQTGCG